MRLVAIDNAKPQVYLARTIYDPDGKIVLFKGTLLNEGYIIRLKELGVSSIYVDDGMEAVKIDETLTEGTRLDVIRHTRDALAKYRGGGTITSVKIRKKVGALVDHIMLNKELMVHLIDIWSLKDHTFSHSVKVCIISLLIGLTRGYNDDQLNELGTGALLHDVGKTSVVDCIVNNKKVLVSDDYAQIQKHAQNGYEILSKSNLYESTALIAWEHHERFDGRGYPRGIAGDAMSEFAKIVAIADVYDALSTDRPYRNRLFPHEVAGVLNKVKGQEFDPKVVTDFFASVEPFPLGSTVVLNDGTKGIVVSIDKSLPCRPRVQVIQDKEGNSTNVIQIIDLMHEPASLHIQGVQRGEISL